MEIFVRSYKDSDGDGIGDLKGLISQLDYLRDLGITGLWLMPIGPSADHDHGYAAVRAVCDLLPGILPPGGYALFHDFNDSRNTTGEYGVYRAVAEMTAGAAMRFAGVTGCCALVQKTG